jgi:hypothetical protein
VYTPVMWKILVPSRLHIFLWFLANNKILTRENLAKRRKLEGMCCLFCNEQESAGHLFFRCCVAKVFWEQVSDLCGRTLGTDFESVAKLWLYEKNVGAVDVCTMATL